MYKKPKKKIKLGILGGTFDPPHQGHLHISKVAIKILKLNKLIWAITKKNPLKKKPHLSISARIKLAKILCNKQKKISIYFYEKKIRSNNTFNMLKYLKKKHRNTKLYFLIGADNLAKFHRWTNWKKIPNFAKIIVFPRKNYLNKKNRYIALKHLNKKDITYINSKKINISSSLIRKFW